MIDIFLSLDLLFVLVLQDFDPVFENGRTEVFVPSGRGRRQEIEFKETLHVVSRGLGIGRKTWKEKRRRSSMNGLRKKTKFRESYRRVPSFLSRFSFHRLQGDLWPALRTRLPLAIAPWQSSFSDRVAVVAVPAAVLAQESRRAWLCTSYSVPRLVSALPLPPLRPRGSCKS